MRLQAIKLEGAWSDTLGFKILSTEDKMKGYLMFLLIYLIGAGLQVTAIIGWVTYKKMAELEILRGLIK